MPAPSATPRARLAPQEWLFLALVIAGWSVFVLSLGKDMSWDFRNYHWYAPYAFLNGRMGFDMAVAHHATYYNPLLDVPFFWLATHTHAWVALAVLGAVQGANIVPLYLIARALFRIPEKALIAGVLSLICMTGGLTISLAGTTYYDNVLSVALLGGLALIITNREVLANGPLKQGAMIAAAAGFLTGMAAGLKLPMAPYTIGFAAALAVLPGDAKHRSTRLLAGAVGGVLGVVLFAGFWWWRLYELTGNPQFPYFNDIFHSPLAPATTFRDTRFLPDTLKQALLYPFLFSIDWRVANDLPFHDIRVGLAYVAVLLTLPFTIFRLHARRGLVAIETTFALFAWAGVSYAVWISMFAIYRYILTLEMLAPIVIVAAIGLWPVSRPIRLSAMGIVLILALATTRAGILERAPLDEPYVQVLLPPIPEPAHAMVLMVGEAPMGFIVPSLPPQIPVLRIDGWLMQPGDGSKLTEIARARVTAHKGAFYLIANPYEMGRARDALTAYDLAVGWLQCRDIETNLGGPYRFCPVERGAEDK